MPGNRVVSGAALTPVAGASAVALRSVDLQVPDLAAARRFYTEAWGLTAVEGPACMVVLRATGADPHVLVLHPGEPGLRAVTFRAPSREAVDSAAAGCVAAGGRIVAPAGAVDWPGGGYGLAFADPQGRTWRLVHGDAMRVAGSGGGGPAGAPLACQRQQHRHRRNGAVLRRGARLPAERPVRGSWPSCAATATTTRSSSPTRR